MTKRDPLFAIKVEDVVKSYAEVMVLRRIKFSLQPGEVAVILGANGAGKSTLLRILAMLTQPDSGSIDIYGNNIAKNGPQARALTGSVLHSPMLYTDMSVRENLTLFAELYRLKNIDTLIEKNACKVGIQSRLDHRVRTLSHGFQKRVALARALMHEPKLLLLDEPESGLDSRSVSYLENVVEEYRSSGRTILMTTHIIEHALEIADKAIVMTNGYAHIESATTFLDKSNILSAYSHPFSKTSGDL
ncbi:MAG: heme ABC exporter ATP-binding protein CcmA [Chloroflexi bacterium]|nr:heme ABC exporter ATP-binding protein CcmA [Chloroflexota bacterium]MQF81012.1 heme ABC exporter ATP-binding protein CcmA [SAR202 cluster bacterium]